MDTNIDSSAFKYTHKVHNVCMDDCKAWLDSPITKALIDLLDRCCILCAVEFGDADFANIHLMGKFDIKQAIIDRQKQPHPNTDSAQ
jgi:hypothetical protein